MSSLDKRRTKVKPTIVQKILKKNLVLNQFKTPTSRTPNKGS